MTLLATWVQDEISDELSCMLTLAGQTDVLGKMANSISAQGGAAIEGEVLSSYCKFCEACDEYHYYGVVLFAGGSEIALEKVSLKNDGL